AAVSEPEDPGIEGALALLAASPTELERRLAEGDESEAALRRQQVEALAALAWALPAEPAPAALRHRLLARLHGDETHLVRPPPPLGPPPQVEALRRPAPPSRVPVRPPRAAPARGWALPLAAVLALCTLGLLGWSGWLWRDLDRTRTELARMRH